MRDIIYEIQYRHHVSNIYRTSIKHLSNHFKHQLVDRCSIMVESGIIVV